jgi:hypothetical protein
MDENKVDEKEHERQFVLEHLIFSFWNAAYFRTRIRFSDNQSLRSY